MTNHPHDDILLKAVLQLLDTDDLQALNRHLKKCPECTERLSRTQAEVALLGSVEIPAEMPDARLPEARRINFMPLLKAAAILVVGFAGGFAVSELLQQESVCVKAQTLQVSSPVIQPDSFISCEEVDTRFNDEAI
ncbi:hypothetical protein KKA00_11085 [bacterium]|nr:hypothetical protein [bacterium]MBU1652757.1 hypothetical protein [bacterium]